MAAPCSTSIFSFEQRVKTLNKEKTNAAYIQYTRQVPRKQRTPAQPRTPDPSDPALPDKKDWKKVMNTWMTDLQVWRELGDITSIEYKNKMVFVRKVQEQEFFSVGYNKQIIEILQRLELDMNDVNAILDRHEDVDMIRG